MSAERLTAAAARLRERAAMVPGGPRTPEYLATARLLDQLAPQLAEVESLGLGSVPGHKPTGVMGAALALADLIGSPAVLGLRKIEPEREQQ